MQEGEAARCIVQIGGKLILFVKEVIAKYNIIIKTLLKFLK